MPHKMMKLFLFRKVKFVLQVVGGWWLCEAKLIKTWEMVLIFKSWCNGLPVWACWLPFSISNASLKS